MNEYRIKGNWKEFKGKVKEQWGRLTDDELDRMEGEAEQLVGAIQKHYGRSKEEAEREVSAWREAEDC